MSKPSDVDELEARICALCDEVDPIFQAEDGVIVAVALVELLADTIAAFSPNPTDRLQVRQSCLRMLSHRLAYYESTGDVGPIRHTSATAH